MRDDLKSAAVGFSTYPELKAALKKLADRDDRSLADVVHLVMLAWITDHHPVLLPPEQRKYAGASSHAMMRLGRPFQSTPVESGRHSREATCPTDREEWLHHLAVFAAHPKGTSEAEQDRIFAFFLKMAKVARESDEKISELDTATISERLN